VFQDVVAFPHNFVEQFENLALLGGGSKEADPYPETLTLNMLLDESFLRPPKLFFYFGWIHF
jgi:hypothetical protein